MGAAFSRDKLFPYESRYLWVEGHRLHYIDEGPPRGTERGTVVMIHGNPTWSFYYRNVIAALKDEYRVIVPDFIGCGLSDRPARTVFRASHRISHLCTFVDELELKDFSLLLHDWGGPLGTGMALRRLERVRGIIYLNTTLTEIESLPRMIRLAATPIIGKYLTMYSKRFLKLTTEWGVHKRLPPEIQAGYFFPYQTSKRRKAIWDFVADIPFHSEHPTYAAMLEIAEGLPRLSSIPVQIIWGLRDPCFHLEMLSKVAAHFPHADVLEIPDASHLVLEDATEQCLTTIRDFLDRVTVPVQVQPSSAIETTKLQEPTGLENEMFRSFSESVARCSDQEAVILPRSRWESISDSRLHYAQIRFSELSSLVTRYQRGLIELGLEPGDKVLMLVPPGLDFLALSFAVMGRGAIPIFLDPGMGRDKLFTCIERCAPQVFIGSLKAHLLRILNRKLFRNLKFHLTAADLSIGRGPNLSLLKRYSTKPIEPYRFESRAAWENAPALVAYTSGATGVPKGVVFTNSMVAQQLSILSKHFGVGPGVRDLPLLAIFSLFHVSLGACSVFPPVDPSNPISLDPSKIVSIINDLKIESSFGSPTLWNKIHEYCLRGRIRLPSLKRVFMAGASVPESVLNRIQDLLDNGDAFTPYGATEALPVTLVSARQLRSTRPATAVGGETGTPVGKPLPELEVRVVAPKEGPMEVPDLSPLPAGEIGEIIVRGGNVSPTYLDLPEANASAKIVDGDRVWHRMGDLGYVDADGNLYYCGRKVHVVRAHDKTFHSVPVERIFDEHAKVRRSALVSLDGGREVGIVIEPFPHFWPESETERALFLEELRSLAKSNHLTQPIREFYFHRSFPTDARHNAKIFRDQLGEWAESVRHASRAA